MFSGTKTWFGIEHHPIRHHAQITPRLWKDLRVLFGYQVVRMLLSFARPRRPSQESLADETEQGFITGLVSRTLMPDKGTKTLAPAKNDQTT